MSDPDAPPLNAGAILKAFLSHDVDFVVVGGIATSGHGATHLTNDLDICPAWNDANLAKVSDALRQLGAQMKTSGNTGLGTQPSVRMIRKMEITTWRTTAGDVDVLLGIPKDTNWQLAQYRQLTDNAVAFDVGGQHILIAALEDIIRSKEIANRPADLAALPELRQLMAQQDAAEPTNPSSSATAEQAGGRGHQPPPLQPGDADRLSRAPRGPHHHGDCAQR